MKIGKYFNEVINEVSDDVYKLIKSKYNNARLIMSKDDEINFTAIPISSQEIRFKPKGLWYGIGSEWIDWVRSEMPEWEVDNVFKIDINESSILRVTNYDELVSFEDKYGVNPQENMSLKGLTDYSKIMTKRYKSIDWAKVAEDFGGIEIAPYIYKARYDHMWYYGWDVASGCIWSDGVITKIDKLI